MGTFGGMPSSVALHAVNVSNGSLVYRFALKEDQGISRLYQFGNDKRNADHSHN